MPDPKESTAPAAPEPKELYAIHSVARARHNRAQRQALPKKPRTKVYVGENAQRVVRGRPIYMTNEQLRKHLDRLRVQEKNHEIEVRTADGRRVDLSTLAAPAHLPEPPKPHFLPDSVNNDKRYPIPEGWTPPQPAMSAESYIPQLVPPGEKPTLLQEQENEWAGTDPELDKALSEAEKEDDK